jgi:hypothetical protein
MEGLDPLHKQTLMQNSVKNSAKVLEDEEPEKEGDNDNHEDKDRMP